MRHLRAGKKLGRNPSHRRALYRNLAMALFQHERIVTTVPKAKAVRPFVEKLITLAKQNTLHARRLVISRLGPAGNAEVKPGDGDDADTRTVVKKLFEELGPRFQNRPGGYTRIIKRHNRRLGDGGETAYLELLKEGETKVKAKQAVEAPAPAVEEEQEEQGTEEQETQTEAGQEGTGEAKAEHSATDENKPTQGDQPKS